MVRMESITEQLDNEMDTKIDLKNLGEKKVRMENTMETPIKSSTHKIINAVYTKDVVYAIPKEWELDDISIHYGDLYYKDNKQECKKVGLDIPPIPQDIVEDDDFHIEEYFKCESDLKNLEVEEVIKTNYTNCIPLATAKWLDLFDDIPYKYLKKLLEEEDDFIVEIEDMPCDRVAWCKTSFTFTLEYEAEFNDNNLEKEFTVIKEYNCSSSMACTIINLECPEESDEEEEEKNESESESESDEWCECCWCGKELTNEKGVMYQDECVCLECHTRTKKMMEIGKERLEEIKNKKESE